jgi:hypothetical protein
VDPASALDISNANAIKKATKNRRKEKKRRMKVKNQNDI